MRGLRKRGSMWIVAAGVAAVAATALVITPGISAPSFLTKKTAKRLFYTKKQSNTRYYTKAQADAQFAPGATQISVSPADWRKTNPVSTVQVNPQSDGTAFSYGGPASSDILSIAPTLPTVLDGNAMHLTGMRLCYTANTGGTNPTLSAVQVFVIDQETSSTGPAVMSDTTDRTDNACRDYAPASPVALDPTDTVYVAAHVEWQNAGGQTFIGRSVAFKLEP